MKQVFYCIIQTFKLKLPDLENINPIQAGVFWNHIDWGGGTLCPLLFLIFCGSITTKLGMMVPWDKISQKP